MTRKILISRNGIVLKPVKTTEIVKSKIQVLLKVGYNLSDLKVSDLNSNSYFSGLEC